jgi:hypothetical protein
LAIPQILSHASATRSDMSRIHRLLTWPAAFYIAGILLWYEQ